MRRFVLSFAAAGLTTIAIAACSAFDAGETISSSSSSTSSSSGGSGPDASFLDDGGDVQPDAGEGRVDSGLADAGGTEICTVLADSFEGPGFTLTPKWQPSGAGNQTNAPLNPPAHLQAGTYAYRFETATNGQTAGFGRGVTRTASCTSLSLIVWMNFFSSSANNTRVLQIDRTNAAGGAVAPLTLYARSDTIEVKDGTRLLGAPSRNADPWHKITVDYTSDGTVRVVVDSGLPVMSKMVTAGVAKRLDVGILESGSGADVLFVDDITLRY